MSQIAELAKQKATQQVNQLFGESAAKISGQIDSYSKEIFLYENPVWLAAALKAIPVDRLVAEAKTALQNATAMEQDGKTAVITVGPSETRSKDIDLTKVLGSTKNIKEVEAKPVNRQDPGYTHLH